MRHPEGQTIRAGGDRCRATLLRLLLVLSVLMGAACGRAGAVSSQAQEIVVEIHAESTGFAMKGWYSPSHLSVKKGTVVKWVNRDWRPHSVTSRAGRFDSGLIKPGHEWAHKFEAEGEYVYECYACFCNPMTGSVVVTRE